MDKKNTIITVTVLVVAVGVLFYRQALTDLVTVKETAPTAEEVVAHRELTDTVTYDVPDGTHTIRFSIFVDDEGVIQDLKAVDTTDPDHQQSVNEFYMTLTPKIKGKKLEELEAVDKVGTSSLTTKAFNEALENIKAQV